MTPQGYVVTVPDRDAVVRFDSLGFAEHWRKTRHEDGLSAGCIMPILPAYDLLT